MAKLLPSVTVIRHPLNVFISSYAVTESPEQTVTLEAPYPPTDFGVTLTQSFSRPLRRRDFLIVELLIDIDRTQWAGKRMRAVVFSETGYTGDHALSYATATQRLVIDDGIDVWLGWSMYLASVPGASGITTNVGFTSVGLTGSPPFRFRLTQQVLRLEPTSVSTVP